jgi:hypothetical protein
MPSSRSSGDLRQSPFALIGIALVSLSSELLPSVGKSSPLVPIRFDMHRTLALTLFPLDAGWAGRGSSTSAVIVNRSKVLRLQRALTSLLLAADGISSVLVRLFTSLAQ